ncbi:MAG: plasmid maintenance system killer protein [Rhodospirillaceae bacterium]|nr:plasmid maintenance system killer protein [Rhodospirillaceae bacterium]MYB14382.1 plasmid maintenance system killer protein [Rhodospirillaceae bacterium]MYI51018.1 plasmid maintenance system killer protein [Rhodospirillaceae bacterium]
MDVEFEDDDLDRLEVDPRFDAGFQPGVVKGFRKAMQAIRAAVDERDIYASRGLRLEKLVGNRQGQHSLRCNDKYRLIVRFEGKGNNKKVHVIEIVDYH